MIDPGLRGQGGTGSELTGQCAPSDNVMFSRESAREGQTGILPQLGACNSPRSLRNPKLEPRTCLSAPGLVAFLGHCFDGIRNGACLNPRIPLIAAIFPKSAPAAPETVEAVRDLDTHQIFCLLVAELAFDTQPQRRAMADRKRRVV